MHYCSFCIQQRKQNLRNLIDMQNIDMGAIMKEFDKFVELSLNKKGSQEEVSEATSANELDEYYHNMEKRLKIKTVTSDQKFQNILNPMKKLKSFVSIKEFLQSLNQKASTNKDSQVGTIQAEETKRKMEYEQLRGGVYMEKIEKHLKQHNLKRHLDSEAEQLLNHLEQNPSENNEYRFWMENTLNKISMKEERFLKPKDNRHFVGDELVQGTEFKRSHREKVKTSNSVRNLKLSEEATEEQDIKMLKRKNFKKRQSQQAEQKNFKKVSNFLSDRLRKILTDKYVSNSTKQIQKNKSKVSTINEIPVDDIGLSSLGQISRTQELASCRAANCRTTVGTKRIRLSTTSTFQQQQRAKTSQLKSRKPFGDVFTNKVNQKMNDLLSEVDSEYQRKVENKKQIEAIFNKKYEDCEELENVLGQKSNQYQSIVPGQAFKRLLSVKTVESSNLQPCQRQAINT